ncbi:MAG: hypothetical protein Q7S87_08120 [Agitococcus sp.]|nr:hypothetical protein [Agitococcus sp.]
MKHYVLLVALLCSGLTQAEMQVLSEDELQLVDGQGGADISLEMRLNHDTNAQLTGCTNYEYCRFALNLNNRNHDASVTGSATGRKLWLVFKQVQGTILFQEIKLDATDLTAYTGKDSAVVVKPAIKLSFDATKPILIRNVGYQSLAIETDTCTESDLNCSVGTVNVPGYLAKGSGGSGATAYANGKYTNATNLFDLGRETGFMGLNMYGNLALAGTVKIFSCDANHPRC